MCGRFLKIELIVLVLAIFMCYASTTLSTYFDVCTYLGRVSGMPTRLFFKSYGDASLIYVRTSNNDTFACNQRTQVCIAESITNLYDCSNDYGKGMLTPFPPGTVAASCTNSIPWGDFARIEHYVALDDGSLWIWSPIPSYGTNVSYYMSAFLFFMFGSGIALFYAIFVSRYRSHKAKNDSKRY